MALIDLKLKAAAAFYNIGKKNGTAPPHSNSNLFSIAYEYFIADSLASIAAKRKDQAKKAALEAGLLEGKFIPGTDERVFTCAELDIIAKISNPATRIDAATLRGKLIREVGDKKAEEIIKFATRENKPVTCFTFV